MIPINTASINLNPQFKLMDMAYNCQLFNSSTISKDHYVYIKKYCTRFYNKMICFKLFPFGYALNNLIIKRLIKQSVKDTKQAGKLEWSSCMHASIQLK